MKVIISFPRSGRGLLVKILREHARVFVEESINTFAGPLCYDFFCTHDFKLDNRTTNPIVLLRDPIDSIKSWYALDVSKGLQLSWEERYRQQVPYWKGFVKKYKDHNIINYETLISDPYAVASKLLGKTITGNTTITKHNYYYPTKKLLSLLEPEYSTYRYLWSNGNNKSQY